jgi:hypothetical protein
MTYLTHIGPAAVAILAALTGSCSGGEQSRSAGAEAGKPDSVALAATVGTSEPRVSSVMIGKRIGSGNRITEPTFEFAPRDTVHVSVGVEGAGDDDSLTAAWRYQSGQIVEQSVQPAPPSGENTAFNLSQPKGLKPGTYKVVLFLRGDSVDTKVFVVRK